MVEGPGFVEGQTGIYVKDITEGGPAQKVLRPIPVLLNKMLVYLCLSLCVNAAFL